jgi:asparagine synthase (glutamine-hydrolysing)
MCGIVGILNYRDHSGNHTVLEAMNNSLRHRGPDADGFYFKPPIELGMRRLKIIDLNTGDQPISNENGTIWTVFNGEIYNYADLRSDLIKKGHIFKTQSDTEVIVHQYEEDGEKCVEKFRGMFAFAVWDESKRQLLLARDRFGIKPLFVAEENDKLTFASEMKALFQLHWVDRTWNPLALRAYLSLGYIPAPLTAYNGIRKFTPGTVEIWQVDSADKITKEKSWRYWAPSVSTEEPAPSFEEAADTILELLKEDVHMHLRSDVPLGAFLSGGVDSSTVVALMRICGAQTIKTFSIGSEHPEFNELPYAELVARHLGTDHYSHVITGSEAHGLVSVIENFDEPFADSSAIPTYFVSQLAREYVTVSLSGDGGDELFAGYAQYPKIQHYRLVDWMPQQARHFISGIGSQLIPKDKRGGGFFRRLGEPVETRYLSLLPQLLDGHMMGKLSSPLSGFLSDRSMDENWQRKYWCRNSVIGAQIVDQMTYLPDDILAKVDITSMQVSLEARVPLLDHVLADQVNKLPTSYKLKNGYRKRLLKHIAAPLLPKSILDRPKRGFSIPLRSWLMGPLKQSVQEYLLDDPSGLFNRTWTSGVINAMENDHSPATSDLVWKLLSLSIWGSQQNGHKPF